MGAAQTRTVARGEPEDLRGRLKCILHDYSNISNLSLADTNDYEVVGLQ